jgi:hypothetical protein
MAMFSCRVVRHPDVISIGTAATSTHPRRIRPMPDLAVGFCIPNLFFFNCQWTKITPSCEL